MNRHPVPTTRRIAPVTISLLLLSGCAAMSTPTIVDQAIYVIDQAPAVAAVATQRDLVLAVSAIQSRPGYDTPQMAYLQRPHELRYFVTSRWAEPPGHMLDPLVLQALDQARGFRAVVSIPGAMLPDLRLDTELVRLQQDFSVRPSRVEVTLRARLIDVRNKRVLAVKEFEETENAASEDAYGGVGAVNRIVPRLLLQLADFCVQASALNHKPGS